MFLNEIKSGQNCIVLNVYAEGKLLNKLLDMGFVKDAELSVLRSAPLKDPIEVKIQGSLISLRKDEADKIEVKEWKK